MALKWANKVAPFCLLVHANHNCAKYGSEELKERLKGVWLKYGKYGALRSSLGLKRFYCVTDQIFLSGAPRCPNGLIRAKWDKS